MEQEELKRKLMGLWEKTTHSSKDLISTLFDYYFNIDLIEYKEIEGRIVSALFGIPYKFGYGRKHLNGLYIISLSSEEGFKKKGVLAELLNNMNLRFCKDFDFTFLVPHTELLEDYFGTQGYFSSFYILEERFTPLHDFRNDYILSITDSDERIKDLKKGLLDEIKVKSFDDNHFTKEEMIKFIESIEKKGDSTINLLHTERDLDYLIQDQNLRNLSSFISYDSDQKISGIAFIKKEELKRLKIVASYVSDSCSYYALLDYIKSQFPDFSITIIVSDPKLQSHSLIQQTYASKNPAGPDLDNTFETIEVPFNINKLFQPLGMVRLLNFEKILDFIAETRSDVDFKLHIRDYNIKDKKGSEEKNKTIFEVKNGKLKIENIETLGKSNSILNLTIKEVSELLLRKNDSTNLIMEAFGIPRLNLQLRLLPY